MKKITAVLTAFVAMLALAAAAGAGPSSESASGGYEMLGGRIDISFSARATLLNTDASGHLNHRSR